MQIIIEQYGKIRNFLIILIPLFLVNALFNLKYDWDGVSVIARIYIMVLSFYVIFIFSQIDIDQHRADYTARYGWIGRYYLFTAAIISPFIFIYLLTIIFTLINYISSKNWPLEPIYSVLDGRFSNTVIYAFILFIVLRQKKRPSISIPLFIIFSIIYYASDRILYNLYTPGIAVSYIKFGKYFIFIFLLIYGFSKSRWKLAASLVLSLFFSAIIFSSVAACFVIAFYAAPKGSYSYITARKTILKAGFAFPLNELQKTVLQSGNLNDREIYFEYMNRYGRTIDFTPLEWESIIQKNKIEMNEPLFYQINKRDLILDYMVLQNYALSQITDDYSPATDLTEFTKFFGSYFSVNKEEFYDLYNSANDPLKIIILKSLAYTDDIDVIYFLIDKLTNVEVTRSETAYNSLKKITGLDPVKSLQKNRFDLDVIMFFRDYAEKKKLKKGE